MLLSRQISLLPHGGKSKPGTKRQKLTVDKHLIVALLYHGKGAYIVTAMQNEDQAQVDMNLPFIENLMFYVATLQDKILAVEPHHKLAVTWSQLKMNL